MKLPQTIDAYAVSYEWYLIIKVNKSRFLIKIAEPTLRWRDRLLPQPSALAQNDSKYGITVFLDSQWAFKTLEPEIM